MIARYISCRSLALLLAASSACFSPLVFAEIPEATLKIMPPMNIIYHPVSTTNTEAQKSFDIGLTYIFAYNHDYAFSQFEKASKLDPNLAMAYWGMALARGQNVNEDVTPENEIICYNNIQKALKLAPQATQWEQDYINALATRYTNVPNADLKQLRYPYRDAMKILMQKYPEDLDAATLYSESILMIDPWKWWTVDGKAKEGTYEAIDVLESVLRRNPDHIGANHFNIHAWEESPFPERGLMSAHRLTYLLPESGHLLHMPCHIFLQVGDYESCVKTSKNSIKQDRDYIQKVGLDAGSYPLHYLSHDLFIFSRAYMLMEDYENAINTAKELMAFVGPHIETMPHYASYARAPIDIYLYFHKWQEILDHPLQAKTPALQAYWHLGRAIALASLGKIDEAKKEQALMCKFKQQIGSDETLSGNPAGNVIGLGDILVNATIARMNNQIPEYINLLKKGVSVQENLEYDEPPAWHVQVRQLLAFAQLEQEQFEDAEFNFRNALVSLQRNGRSLFGQTKSLQGLGRNVDAFIVEREAHNALKNATIPLKLENMLQ